MKQEINQQIIIDITYPMNRETLNKIIQAVTNTMHLLSNIDSTDRKICIALSSISNQFFTLYPFKWTRDINRNYSHLIESLKRLDAMGVGYRKLTPEEFRDLLHVAVKTTSEDFGSYMQLKESIDANLKDKELSLKIMVITSKSVYKFRDTLEAIAGSLTKSCLKGFQVLEVTDGQDNEKEYTAKESSSIVEEIKITTNSLEDTIKKSFFESECKVGHLIIYMPNIILYGDMTSSLIIPEAMEFFKQNLQSQCIEETITNSEGNEYKMEVINKIIPDGICESHIIGYPIKVTPMKSLQENQAKYLTNYQTFVSLCEYLMQADEYLLLNHRKTLNGSQTYSYFMMRPGNGTMLLKTLAPGDLILPKGKPPNNPLEISQRSKWSVENSLKEIVTLQDYDPENFLSGLTKPVKLLSNSKKRALCNQRPADECVPLKRPQNSSKRNNESSKSGKQSNLLSLWPQSFNSLLKSDEGTSK